MATKLPRLTRPRHDGWSPEVQQRFLNELAYTASPALAAAAAGRTVRSAYQLRARPDATAFRDGWANAMRTCMTHLREQALDRAFNGHVAPIIKHGRKVGERPVIRDAMLMCLLRLYDAPAFHAERAQAVIVAKQPQPLTFAEFHQTFEAAMISVQCSTSTEVIAIADEIACERVKFE